MKKIAIVGTHGVGKTTLCKALVEYAKAQGRRVECVGEMVRDCPYPINRDMTYKACEWIVLEQIARERKAERANPELIICDRSAFDPIIYLNELGDQNNTFMIECQMFPFLKEFTKVYLATYQDIFLVKSLVKSVDSDGFRDTGMKFHSAINEMFFRYFCSKSTAQALFVSAPIREATKVIDSCDIFHNVQAICKEIYECVF